MAKTKPEYGTFKNGIPYARFGQGKKDLIAFLGGPGNAIPKGTGLWMYSKGLQPFAEEYTIHMVTRKLGLTEGYTTQNMSDDYAEMIQEAFDGHVDVVIGISYGGMIAQHFAADHADCFDHLVIAMAAHKASEVGRQVDYRFAELLSQGKSGAAYATMAEIVAPKGPFKPLMRALLWVAGGLMGGKPSATFAKDVMIEAEAELAHDAADSLGRIKVPVLVLCGDADVYFPASYALEMTAMIEDASIKLYRDKGHTIIMDKRFAQDVQAFIEGRD